MNTAWLAPLTDSRVVRQAADSLLVRLAHRRTLQLDRMDAAAVQEATLLRHVRRAARTKFGQDHYFAHIRTVKDYQDRVPLREYEYFWQTYWKDAYPRLDNITWPGKFPYYALSSGTTSGTTKFIPVSRDMVRSNAKAAFTTLALFRHAFPRSELFTGKFFFLGGSTDLRAQADGSLAGDLSGIAAKEVLDALRPYTFPPPDLTLISDWEVKVQRLAEQSLKERITAISGVPSWMLILFDRVKQLAGKATLAEAWPDLRLVVHGGTKFEPYRELFRKEIGSDRVQFCEVYPCSEGFIATEDPRYPGTLRVVPDHGNVFEFVPVEDLGKDKPARHTLRTVETGVQYAVAVTSCAGVWSYLVGDTVAFERRTPPLIRFTGRTKYFLSAFGEHLIQDEVDSAVAVAAQALGVATVDHHVGPIFPTDPRKPGHHLYFVEFRDRVPDLTQFAKWLDDDLCRRNEDYAAHRVGDLTMLRPVIRAVRVGGFADWMKSRGKFGGQNKVPRMDNTGAITNQLASYFNA